MTNMSKALREKLKKVAEIRGPEVVYDETSKDGTRKWVMRMDNGNSVETVLIPDGERGTLCVSSQIGCSLDCTFCSTGKRGFNRNLTAAEVIGQVWVARKAFMPFEPGPDRPITNVVMMGMGEPLLNFDNVVDAMNLMMEDLAYGISSVGLPSVPRALCRLWTACRKLPMFHWPFPCMRRMMNCVTNWFR